MTTRLAPGDTAPDFTLPTADGGELTLSSLRGQHVIVYFYPAAMTPGCSTQACDFRDSLEALHGQRLHGRRASPPTRSSGSAEFAERDGPHLPAGVRRRTRRS